MRRALKIIAAVFIGLIVLVGAALAALHTRAGGAFVSSAVMDAAGGSIELEGLRLSGIFNLKLDRVTLKDEASGEVMLEANRLVLDWAPLALTGGVAKINRIEIDRLRYADVGGSEEKVEEPSEDSGFALPQLPVSIALGHLVIDRVELAAPSFGLESVYDVSAAGTLDAAFGEAHFNLTSSRLDSEGRLTVRLDYGPTADHIKFAINFQDSDGTPIAALAGLDGGALSVSLEGEGPIQQTEQTFSFDMAKGPQAAGQWQLSYDEALAIDGQLTVRPRGFGGPDVERYAGETVALDFSVQLEDDRLNASLHLPVVADALQGDVALSANGKVDEALDFTLAVTDLSGSDIPTEFAPLQALLVGAFDLEANRIDLAPSQVTSPAGLVVDLSGAVPFDGPVSLGMKIDVAALQSVAPGLFGTASLMAKVDMPGLGLPVRADLSGGADLATQEGGPLSPVRLSGSVAMDASNRLNADVDIDIASLGGLVEEEEASAQASLSVSGPMDGLSGRANLNASARGQTLAIVAPFGFDGTRLDLTDLTLSGMGVEGKGSGTVPLDGSNPSGTLALSVADIAPLAGLAGMNGRGRLSVNAKANPDGALEARIDAAEIELPAEGIAVLKAQIDIKPKGAGLVFAISTEMLSPVAATLATQGSVRLEDATTVQVQSLEGAVNAVPLKLAKPLEVTLAGEDLSVKGLALALGGGEVRGDVSLAAEAIKGDIRIVGVTPPEEFTGGIGVPVYARLQASGTRKRPTIRLQAETRVQNDRLDKPIVTRLDVKADYQSASGQLNVVAADATLGARFKAPITLDLESMNAGLRGTADLTVDGVLALVALEPFMLGDGSRFAGTMTLDAKAEISPDRWQAGGKACFDKGLVDLAATGTVIKDVEGCIARAPDGKMSGALKGRDRKEGSFTASFDGVLAGGSGDLMNAAIALKKFRLMDSDLGIVVASSSLSAETRLGEGLEGQIKGKLRIDSGDLIIPGNPGPSIETIEVRHVGRPEDGEAEAAQTGAPFGEKLALDIRVDVPSGFFVRGRGLESEWEGGLDVRGTVAAPSINGQIDLRKGSANAGVSTLELTDGEIKLFTRTPGTPPVVLIMLESESNVEGTVARMRVEGPAEDPDITFSSTPELPQDEILARLIFGKPASELTAVEAAQLGSAALTLSGALGGGPGVFDKLRRGLGVDRIAFDPSVDNPASSSVTVGKYVTPKVYVSVKQDVSGAAPGIAVDYEVTRRVTLSAEDDGAGGESAGVKYKFDY